MKYRDTPLFLFVLIFLALLLEIFLLRNFYPLWMIIGFRIVVGSVFFYWLPRGVRQRVFARPLLIWIAIFWVLAGIFAIPVFIFAFIFYFRRQSLESRVEQFQEYIFEDTYLQDELHDLLEEIFDEEKDQVDREDNIQPLMDVLLSDNISWKMTIIVQLKKYHNPTSIILLRKALEDPHPEVKLLAANILSKIDDYFISRIQKAEAVLRDMEGEERKKPLLELAKYLDKGLYIDLWGAEIRQYYLHKALVAYYELTSLDPGNMELIYLFCRFLIRNEMLEEALRYLDENLIKEPNNPRLLVWKMEVFFRQKEYKKLVDLSGKISLQDLESPKIKSAVMWWQSA